MSILKKFIGLNPSKVKPRQIWEHVSDNPFDDHPIDTYEVLDVRHGYVKYRLNGKSESSQIVKMFTFNKNLVVDV